MAKKQSFGTEGAEKKASQRRMAKVIVPKKTANNKYAYKEAIIDQNDVRSFIQENKD